jgi:hypothetical protein
MNPSELSSILANEEGATLEFKRSYEAKGQGKDRIHAEIAKDLLALVNSLSQSGDTGLIILGADNSLLDGHRPLFSIAGHGYSRTAFLDIFNSRCTPPLTDLNYEEVELNGEKIGVITVSASPEVHSCTKDLVTPHKTWPQHSVLIRRGEQVGMASPSDIMRLQREKSLWSNRQVQKAPQIAQAYVIQTPLEFKNTIGADAGSHHILVCPTDKFEKRLREIIRLIFEDLSCIEPSDLGMVMTYLEGIEEPLEELRQSGVVLFCVVRQELMKSGSQSGMSLS